MDPSAIYDIQKCMEDELERYHLLNKKFQKACRQVILLNNQILDIQTRYNRAKKNSQKSQRYVGRLRLSTLEGVRNMIYEYARQRAELLDAMQDRLVAVGLMDDLEE